jgi:hypothetical protein
LPVTHSLNPHQAAAAAVQTTRKAPGLHNAILTPLQAVNSAALVQMAMAIRTAA